MKTIYICDDHSLFREGEVSMFSAYSDEFEVVGSANNGFQASQEIRQLQPDVVLLDLNLPGKTGLEVLTELRTLGETPLVIIIISYNDQTLMRKVPLYFITVALSLLLSSIYTTYGVPLPSMAMELELACPAEKPAEPSFTQLWAEAPVGVISKEAFSKMNAKRVNRFFIRWRV
jgi:CheY-like chemotaxis protein